MSNSPIISVIIPVYQAESYLRRCLESIANQIFTDYEVILVNDGSKDRSGQICDEFVQLDGRFKVIHKKNEGVSVARQVGLDNSNGNYVIHADPDDWVEPNWLLYLYNKIEDTGADMVICDYDNIKNDGVEYSSQQPTTLNNNDILNDFLTGKIGGQCWNKLVRRKCFEEFNISFHPEMNLWEDVCVMCKLVSNGIKVDYIPKALYHYDSVINENSIVVYRKQSHIYSAMIFVDEINPILTDKQFDEGWYRVKSLIKLWIFTYRNIDLDIVNTYPEINERFIKEAKMDSFYSKKNCIAFCLKGHSCIGYSLFYITELLRNILHKNRIFKLL